MWFVERVEDAGRDIFAGRRAFETPVDVPVEPTFVNMEIDASSLGVVMSDWPSDNTLVIPIATHGHAGHSDERRGALRWRDEVPRATDSD